MPTIKIPTPLRTYTAGQAEIPVQGHTVSEVMSNLMSTYPALRPHLYNNSGELRPFVNLFLGEDNIRELDGIETPVKENDRLMLIPSIAGGTFKASPREVA